MSPTLQVITISDKAVNRLRAGHLWVFVDDLSRVEGVNNGDVVAVRSERGKEMGSALYSAHSQIALRWLADPGVNINKDFWLGRLKKAIAYRASVVKESEAYRVVFGEGDLLPSLVVDRYGEYLVLQTLSSGMDRLKALWIELLQALLSPRAIIERNDAKVRRLEDLPLVRGVVFGNLSEPVEYTANGVRWEVDLLAGQKTGAFLDQRENYCAAEAWAGQEALDCFCYAGGFALHLARRGARVTAIDISSEALGWARRNAELNRLTGIEWIEGNVFDQMKGFDRQGRRFDSVVLDPPAFAKNRAAAPAALRGYKEINLRALKLLKSGGVLVTCSCSYHVDFGLFMQVVAAAAADAHRPIRLIEARSQAHDHPILLSMPETRYLKCLLVQVLS